MNPYFFCFLLGSGGFLVMVLTGFGHGHGGGARGHGSAQGGKLASGRGVAGLQHGAPHSAHHPASSGKGKNAAFLLSPRLIFSLVLGFGAAGLLVREFIHNDLLQFFLALIGAIFFDRCLVEPISNFVFRFASTPSRTLEDAVLEEAKAVTNFDAHGEGLVLLEWNGQAIQMLARLDRTDAEVGIRVLSGDRVSIMSVDPKRNSCTVTPVNSLPL